MNSDITKSKEFLLFLKSNYTTTDLFLKIKQRYIVYKLLGYERKAVP